ncbi:MAG: T9SS type A sorting domain-containing protein [FCB group bacterium]|nr:T9SS type A sorting domain-containing protein [FCB group bacterium]
MFQGINIYQKPIIDLVDIDNDGDLDLFLGVGQYNMDGIICYYRNDGDAFNLDMQLVSEFFLEINVGQNASPEFCDIDGDSDYDLFIGCEDGKVWYYENIGTPESCDFEYVTNYYDSIDVGNMSVPRFCDIDGDGDYDLFAANESAGNSAGFVGDMDYYENIGTVNDPDFQFITGQYLFMDMSAKSSPYAVDINDNGLYELLVGTIDGNIVYFENEGTVESPELVYTDSCFLNLNLSYQPIFSFRDLDNDTDFDMVVRRMGFSDYIDLYENTGSPDQPEFAFWQNIASSEDWSQSGVDFCDIDGDDDYDVFFGDGYNQIQYYENIGNTMQPQYRFITENYLNQPYQGGKMFPRFNDIDHDGDFDLFMGYYLQDSYIFFWRNWGDPLNADFVLEDTLFYYEYPPALHPRPCLADIDADGDDDMFVGESGGALLFFRNNEFSSVNPHPDNLPITFTLRQNYPNPFNARTVIPFTLDRAGKIKIDIFDITGRSVGVQYIEPLQAGTHEIVWNAEGVASGVYLVRLSVDGGSLPGAETRQPGLVRKVVLVK